MFPDLCWPFFSISTLIYCCKNFLLWLVFFSTSVCVYHLCPSLSSQSNPSISRPDCSRCPCFTVLLTASSSLSMRLVPLGPLCSRIWNILERHIWRFRGQKDMPWQWLFEVASQGEPEPERRIWETIKKHECSVTLPRLCRLMEGDIDSTWKRTLWSCCFWCSIWNIVCRKWCF